MKIGVVTSSDLSRYFHSKKEPYFTHDDQVLVDYMRGLGFRVEPVVWTESNELTSFDYIVMRSAWDYMDSIEKRSEFSRWLLSCTKKGLPLMNDAKIMLWNLDKHYLKEVHSQQVDTVETVYSSGLEKSLRKEIERLVGIWGKVVLKPCVSAAAKDTFLIQSETDLNRLEEKNGKIEGSFEEFIAERHFMLQPFINSVTTGGEWSLVYIAGRYSHAVRKTPPTGHWLVQDELGGSVRSEEPSNDLIKAANKALKAVENISIKLGSKKPLYARLDFLYQDDLPKLGEIELIEPELFFLTRNQNGSTSINKEAVRLFTKSLQQT